MVSRIDRLASLTIALALLSPAIASAQSAASRRIVELSFEHRTAFGESVYVVGDIPVLGAGDPVKALRLNPQAWPRWSAKIAAPSGAKLKVRYLVRDNNAQFLGDLRNGNWLTDWQELSVPGAATSQTFRVEYFSSWARPSLNYREGGAWKSLVMRRVAAGRGPRESRWSAELSLAQAELDFVISDGAGNYDLAASGKSYRTARAVTWLQDGELFGSDPGFGGKSSRVVVVRNWQSRILGNARDIHIYLPRRYDESSRRYPVIYAHDGQNLFGPDALFGGWRAELAADEGIRQGRLEDLIIVGVGNTMDRMNEYIPPEDGGTADRYARFLVEELKPWVDSNLRTLSDASNTAVMGSSLGGIVSLYIGWNHPRVFGKVASLSGSYWLDKFTRRLDSESLPNLQIWLDSGTAGASADGFDGTYAVRDKLMGRGMVVGQNLHHRFDLGASHNERAWRGRVGEVMETLFPAR